MEFKRKSTRLNGRLAAVLAEGALRSALVSSTLKSRRSEESRRPRSRKGRGWGSSWSVRGTALGWVLDEGAMFLKASTSAGDVQAFPHLASLQFTRPTHRLRAEMIWGSPRAITMWSSFGLAGRRDRCCKCGCGLGSSPAISSPEGSPAPFASYSECRSDA